MYRRSLSNLLGGSLLVATVAALNACGGEAPGGDMTTPSAGTTGAPTPGSSAGTPATGAAGKTGAPTATGTAGAKAATAGTMSTTSPVMTAAGKSGGAGTTAASGAAGAAGGGTAAAAGGMATAAAGTSAAGSGAAGGGAATGGTLGGPLKYTGMFTMGTTIPPKHKCPMDVIGGGMGDNKSPALSWTGGPADTKSFAIVLYDTMYTSLHWAIWDIPATVNELPEGLPSGYELMNPMGAHQAAQMGTDKHAYFGPCSSGAASGTYEYRLYAMKVDKLGLMESTTGNAAQMAIEGMMLEKVIWSGKPGM